MLGGISRECGGLALQVQSEPKVTVLATEVMDSKIRISSTTKGRWESEIGPFIELCRAGQDPIKLKHWLTSCSTPAWTINVLGAIYFFTQQTGCIPEAGLSFAIACDLPSGLGMGSGIALRVATLRSLEKLSNSHLTSKEYAQIAQKVGQHLLDKSDCRAKPITSVFGKPGSILPIETAKGEPRPHLEMPKGVSLFIWSRQLESQNQRSLYRLASISALTGQSLLGPAVEGLPTPSAFERFHCKRLPSSISIRELPRETKDKIDLLADFDSSCLLRVREALRLAVNENHRSQLAAQALCAMGHNNKRKSAELLGELLIQSHFDHSKQLIPSPTADEMVEALMAIGPAEGLYGGRLSGDGHACTVLVLADKKALPRLRQLSRDLLRESEPLLPIL